jgi:hypothetical protein|tara:strand:+ start:5975 stop:6253 length:279 start_codon:yes stop_codon:yes gene_type:complete
MVKIEYKGGHLPAGLQKDVNEDDLKKYTSSGWFVIGKEESPIEKMPVEKPGTSWTEKKIKQWIHENEIPVEYNIANDNKADILEELKTKGYL